MRFSRLPHLHASRRKSKPLEIEPLEARQTPSQGGLGAAGTLVAAAAPPGQYTLTTLNSFNGANGATPGSSLVVDAHGNLFGTTLHGGAKGRGAIYVIPTGTQAIGALAFFGGKQGSGPAGSLLIDSQNNIDGTAARGGKFNKGTLFTLNNGKSVISPLVSFNGVGNGSRPAGGLTTGAQGYLYGTTPFGGPFHAGTVFVVSPGSPPLRTLASFNRYDGAQPTGTLVSDPQGDLFGTTQNGGIQGRGTVFEIVAGTSTITKIASFNGTNGAHPLGPLMRDAAGDLFGTTTAGGAGGLGTIFEIAASTSTITRLASFSNATGYQPTGALVRDAQGDLIGTAQRGGAEGQGTVFELAPGSSIATPLVVFTGSNGARPTGSLVIGAQGIILGTTAEGGKQGKGTVFQLTPDS
jgi:uncharacterized repeat protein (TIGR03803 family)